jgi:hypothetical protein
MPIQNRRLFSDRLTARKTSVQHGAHREGANLSPQAPDLRLRDFPSNGGWKASI